MPRSANPLRHLVADESVDGYVVQLLRSEGYPVYYIAEEDSSISDDKVLQKSVDMNALLITEDKDFGELVIRLKKRHCGILLLRFAGAKSTDKAQATLKAIKLHGAELFHAFSVLDSTKLRVRKLDI